MYEQSDLLQPESVSEFKRRYTEAQDSCFSQIGRYGFCKNFIEKRTNRQVTVKIVSLCQIPGARLLNYYNDLRTEVLVHSRIQSMNCNEHHPNIIRFLGWFYDEGNAPSDTPYLGNVYILFEQLYDKLDRRFYQLTRRQNMGLSEEQARPIIQQLASALQFLHMSGVAHRKITISNLICASPNRENLSPIKLTDFSKACIVERNKEFKCSDSGQQKTQTGMEVDCYAVGCILYQLLTKKPVFKNIAPKCGKAGCVARVAGDNPDDCTACKQMYIYHKQTNPFDITVTPLSCASFDLQDLLIGLLHHDRRVRMDSAQLGQHVWVLGFPEQELTSLHEPTSMWSYDPLPDLTYSAPQKQFPVIDTPRMPEPSFPKQDITDDRMMPIQTDCKFLDEADDITVSLPLTFKQSEKAGEPVLVAVIPQTTITFRDQNDLSKSTRSTQQEHAEEMKSSKSTQQETIVKTKSTNTTQPALLDTPQPIRTKSTKSPEKVVTSSRQLSPPSLKPAFLAKASLIEHPQVKKSRSKEQQKNSSKVPVKSTSVHWTPSDKEWRASLCDYAELRGKPVSPSIDEQEAVPSLFKPKPSRPKRNKAIPVEKAESRPSTSNIDNRSNTTRVNKPARTTKPSTSNQKKTSNESRRDTRYSGIKMSESSVKNVADSNIIKWVVDRDQPRSYRPPGDPIMPVNFAPLKCDGDGMFLDEATTSCLNVKGMNDQE